jgi:methylenetetrahydrofolate dehydrogenase (NADP+) / methenyltetrahydrofolate cyclohydrolase
MFECMKAQILDGKKVAGEILEELKEAVYGKSLKLVVVHVGENAVSAKYIQEKQKAAESIGVEFLLAQFPDSISQENLRGEIQKLAKDKTVSGIVVQLPLPKHIQREEALNEIPVEKDVDVLSSGAFESFALGTLKILPPTVAAVKALIDFYEISLIGKHVALVGAGRLVGLPLEAWLKIQHIETSVVTAQTQDIGSILRKADIVISGVGKANLVNGDMIQEGAVVIDAGTSVESGVTKGDIDFESVVKKASFVTPVPGGVGPLVVVCLLRNLFTLSA